MVKTAADGVLMVGFLMIIPGHALLYADSFKYRARMLLITVYLLGSLGSLVWLVAKFGVSDSWHALGEVQHKLGFIGWVFTVMFFLAVGSPLIAAWEYRAARNYQAKQPVRRQIEDDKPSLKWAMVRYEIDLETAPDNRLWLWAFVTPTMTAAVGLVGAAVAANQGRWGAAIVVTAITVIGCTAMVYFKLRVVLPIMHRRYPGQTGNT